MIFQEVSQLRQLQPPSSIRIEDCHFHTRKPFKDSKTDWKAGFNPDIPLVIQKRIKACEGAQKARVLKQQHVHRGKKSKYSWILPNALL